MTSRRLALIAFLLVSACGSYRTRPAHDVGPLAPESVCVVREAGEHDDATVPVWDNGRLVGATTGASYFCYPAEPGKHEIVSELLVTANLAVTVRPGAMTWVRQEVGRSGFAQRGRVRRREWVALRAIEEEEGLKIRSAAKRLEVEEVPRDDALPSGARVPARSD